MRRLASLLILCALALSACGTATQGSATSDGADGSTSPSESAAPAASSAPSGGAEEARSGPVPDALKFRAETIGGDAFDARDLAGRPAVLWFWAPWCPTCRAQVPGVSALADEYGDRVGIVGVGGLDEAANMDDFAAAVDDEVTLLADEEGAVWRRFGVTEQSTYVVLDASGDTVASGYLDDDELAAVVDDLTG